MTIRRLRPKYTPEELAEIYNYEHDHSIFPDHVLRIQTTLALAADFLDDEDGRGADLSAGDGYILRNIRVRERIFGDYRPGYEYTGPIEYTLQLIGPVDVFVLCETLEHLDDPTAVLKLIRAKSKKLILSTPLDEYTDDNPEHYWGWDRAGVLTLLKASGWQPQEYRETMPQIGYRFQIWGCT